MVVFNLWHSVFGLKAVRNHSSDSFPRNINLICPYALRYSGLYTQFIRRWRSLLSGLQQSLGCTTDAVPANRKPIKSYELLWASGLPCDVNGLFILSLPSLFALQPIHFPSCLHLHSEFLFLMLYRVISSWSGHRLKATGNLPPVLTACA
jgi:hypothetical protein